MSSTFQTDGGRYILNIIARAFGCPVEMIVSKSRSRVNTDARALLCVILRELYGWQLSEIGNALNLDHSTVSVAINKARNLYKLDKDFKSKAERVIELL